MGGGSGSPRAERPIMAEGYLDPTKPFELLPWSWAEDRLAEARTYWVATTSPDGRPHVRPVWGVWRDGAVWFSTGSRIATHLERDPRASVHLDDGDRAVILEGPIELVSDHDALVGFAEAYGSYDVVARRWPGYGYAYPFLELALHRAES